MLNNSWGTNLWYLCFFEENWRFWLSSKLHQNCSLEVMLCTSEVQLQEMSPQVIAAKGGVNHLLNPKVHAIVGYIITPQGLLLPTENHWLPPSYREFCHYLGDETSRASFLDMHSIFYVFMGSLIAYFHFTLSQLWHRNKPLWTNVLRPSSVLLLCGNTNKHRYQRFVPLEICRIQYCFQSVKASKPY